MLIPGLNQLADPEIVKVDKFEALLAEFKTFVVEYVKARAPEDAARLEEALENESELVTMLLEAFTLRLQNHSRMYNEKIKQMLAWLADGSNLDARAADMGLKRRVISEGDADAFPVVPAEAESDDDLRMRYYLAPHAPAAGSRLQYQREILALGERAAVTVETPSAGVVVVTYTYPADSTVAKIKDGNGRRVAPGEVDVTVLARAGDGTPDAALLAAVVAHFARDDVKPETDAVEVKAAEIVPYAIKAKAFINAGPDSGLTKAAAETQLQAYADSCHRLGGRVERTYIDYVLHKAGAVRLEVSDPLAPVVCTDRQAPYCTSVIVEVETL